MASKLTVVAKQLFDKADKDGDGKLNHEELVEAIHEVYTKLGMKWVTKYKKRIETEVLDAMVEVDQDFDGMLNLAEFTQLLLTRKPWTTLLDGLESTALARVAPEFDHCTELHAASQALPHLRPYKPTTRWHRIVDVCCDSDNYSSLEGFIRNDQPEPEIMVRKADVAKPNEAKRIAADMVSMVKDRVAEARRQYEDQIREEAHHAAMVRRTAGAAEAL